MTFPGMPPAPSPSSPSPFGGSRPSSPSGVQGGMDSREAKRKAAKKKRNLLVINIAIYLVFFFQLPPYILLVKLMLDSCLDLFDSGLLNLFFLSFPLVKIIFEFGGGFLLCYLFQMLELYRFDADREKLRRDGKEWIIAPVYLSAYAVDFWLISYVFDPFVVPVSPIAIIQTVLTILGYDALVMYKNSIK